MVVITRIQTRQGYGTVYGTMYGTKTSRFLPPGTATSAKGFVLRGITSCPGPLGATQKATRGRAGGTAAISDVSPGLSGMEEQTSAGQLGLQFRPMIVDSCLVENSSEKEGEQDTPQGFQQPIRSSTAQGLVESGLLTVLAAAVLALGLSLGQTALAAEVLQSSVLATSAEGLQVQEVATLADAALDAAVSAGQSLREACAEEFGGTDLDTVIGIAAVVEAIALVGAAVGGTIARQRKQEMERVNAQLRQININLRKQARVESYAPALSYAPVGSPGSLAAAAAAPAAASTSAPAAASEAEGLVHGAPNGVSIASSEPGPGQSGAEAARDSRKEEVIRILKTGKRFLRGGDNAGACNEFKKALALAQELGDVVEEKKAARGVGASLQRQGKHKEAIKYHTLVLSKSKKSNEHSGDTEAYGAIADCYTEMGDLETAAKFYDQYIAHLEDEDED